MASTSNSKSKSLEDLVNDNDTDGFIYPSDVEESMLEVIGGTDPLDGPDFDPVDYINSLFPTEQSLANIDEVVTRIRTRIRKLDDDIRNSIHKQTITVENGKQSLEETKESIREVFQKIKDIKERADKSEEMVKEITCDIKQLDHGKRHLTNSITTLNHLHMLVGGVDSLVTLSKNRQYGEVANLLEGVVNVLEHFKKYDDIPQIKQLSDRVKVIQATLGQQVLTDFKENVSLGDFKPGPNSILYQCCRVANALERKIKDEMLMWFIKLQLADYLNVYNESFDVAWIDKIDRRYSWFKRLLIQFEEDYKDIFPLEWAVDERISMEFSQITRRELEKIMSQRKTEIDVKLLLFAIQRTTAFEGFLSKRFNFSQIKKEKPEFDFNGLISRCFESHLHIYIEAQERNLSDLMDKFIADYKVHGIPSLNDENEGYVLPSAGELFVFYKKCMVQCLQLSNSKPLLDLAEAFKKYLVEYGNKLLLGNLPKVTSASGITSILKDKDSDIKFNEEEKRTICCMLTTAEYCQETTQQLQDKLREKISSELTEKVDMNTQQDLFHGVISTSIQLLVQDLENLCEPALSAMIKVNWQNVESVGDQSAYVTAIISHLRSTIPMARDNLYSSRKYFTQFCIKFVNSFIPRYINNVYKCKPLSDVGAEQLLLDTHSIKTVLLDLPSLGSTVQRKPPNSFTKIVIKGMSKAEMILKVVMSPHQPQTVFVDSYIRLLGDTDVSNFQKLLEMKGLKRNEQHSLLETFRGKLSATPSKTDSSNETSTSTATESSRIRRLEKLIKKQF